MEAIEDIILLRDLKDRMGLSSQAIRLAAAAAGVPLIYRQSGCQHAVSARDLVALDDACRIWKERSVRAASRPARPRYRIVPAPA